MEYQEMQEKMRRENQKKREFVDKLRMQINEKQNQVYLSREEFQRDREMVNKVVQKIIEEEMR
jgi:hypothetical protein